MAAKKSQRAMAGFLAALFLITSSAVTITVIYTLATGKNKASDSATNTQEVPVEQRLQGKPLANFTPLASIPELKTEDTKPGTGEEVKPGANVTVDYTGAVAATGLVFQSSKDSGKPVPLSLSQVIAGWSQGIPGMKVGGERRLYIPAALAYGSQPPQGSGIPANADLVFDVAVYSVQK